jgi:deoxycytidine triphosphate deaminase
VSYTYPFDFPYADSDKEAAARANAFRSTDPFPTIPPALLSSEHISDYVRVTGLLHPFFPQRSRLKSASYEARAKRFIRWDNDGRKIITDVDADGKYIVPENSITFVQIESKIRLPEYIALRFNLRIQHVHRGLLLGTGPLVDPGFSGDLLIPLHNLTSDKYELQIEKGMIWIEFTKTTHNVAQWPSAKGEFFSIEAKKTDLSFETYFERANSNNPIQSSIPAAVKEARDSSKRAAMDAHKAARTNKVFASIGFLAIVGMVLAAAGLAVSIVRDAAEASAEAQKATIRVDELSRRLEDTRLQLDLLDRRTKDTLRSSSQGEPGKPLDQSVPK